MILGNLKSFIEDRLSKLQRVPGRNLMTEKLKDSSIAPVSITSTAPISDCVRHAAAFTVNTALVASQGQQRA